MTLEFRDLTEAFGAEVIGFNPEAPLEDDVRGALQDAFDRRGVLLFRDIDLSHAQQVGLCRMLIREEGTTDGIEQPVVDDNFYISNRRPNSAAPFGRLQFHSDTMWAEQPFEVLSLYGVEVEEPAVPTTFVSATYGWVALPSALRARAGGLLALHTAGEVRRGDLSDVLLLSVENPPSTIKRVDWIHPRTGRPMLYVCEQMTKEIVGLDHSDSEALLEELFDCLYDPATRWNHSWRTGDLVVWDNLAVQHARQNVAGDGPARTLRKVASPMLRLSPDQMPSYSAPG